MLFLSKKSEIRRIECAIAGKKARMEATQRLIDSMERMPGRLVLELIELPQQIAELETRLKHLTTKL